MTTNTVNKCIHNIHAHKRHFHLDQHSTNLLSSGHFTTARSVQAKGFCEKASF